MLAAIPELKYEYFEFEEPIDSTLQLFNMEASADGIIDDFDFPFPDNELPENFGLIISGYIDVKTTEVYKFSVLSNDGSRLYVSEELVVNNDGWHGVYEKEGSIALKPGQHRIKLLYFQVGGSKELEVYLKIGNSEKEAISKLILSQ